MSEIVMSRRKLLKAGAQAALALAAARAMAGSTAAASLPWPMGLQLFTLSAELRRDPLGTLQQVAALGFKEIEYSAVPGKTAAEMRRMMDDLGLTVVSYHGSPANLLYAQPARQIEDAKTLGAQYLVCPLAWAKDPARASVFGLHKGDAKAGLRAFLGAFTLDDWKWNADSLNTVGEKCRNAGIQMAYHNHGFEFTRFGDVLAFDELLRLTDPALVTMEMDCAWVVNAGQDPARYLEQYPSRIQLLHVKDVKSAALTTDMDILCTEVGSGVIPWPSVLRAARKSGVKHCFIEQEPPFDRPPLEAVKISRDYLNGMKI